MKRILAHAAPIPQFLLLCIVSGALVWTFAREASALPVASDAASDSAYAFDATGSWKGLNPTVGENPAGMDNGGFGFDPWNFAGGFHDPLLSPYGELNHFIDGVDFPASSFNDLSEPAFGLTNSNLPYSGYTSRATRTFAPLGVGDTVSLNFDNPLLQPFDPFFAAGFLFRLNAGGGPVIDSDPIPGVEKRFEVVTTSNFNSGRWYTTDLTGFSDTGVADADTASGATFRFTITGEETYSMEIERLSDGQTLFSRSGELSNTGAGAVDTLEIALFRNGSGDGLLNTSPTGQREFFFNDLQISSQDIGIPGDYNGNEVVDAADYTVWRDTMTAGGTVLANDLTPGMVDESDFIYWRAHFGETLGSGGGSSQAAVPEPSTLVILLVGTLATFLCRTRQFHQLVRV